MKFGNDQIIAAWHFDETSRWIGWSKNEFSHSLSLQATRDGVFLRRPGYGGLASSAIADHVINPACLDIEA
jgi:hypothetical protein